MSNFAFLQTEWPLMHESALRVEATANTDARILLLCPSHTGNGNGVVVPA